MRRAVATALALGLVVVSFADAQPKHRAVRSGRTGIAAVDRVIVVVLENADAAAAMQQPFLASLARRGALVTQFHDVGHPSQPNYIALAAADTMGVTNDAKVTIDARNLADLLEEHGVSWKIYAESYPGNCDLRSEIGDRVTGIYARRHVPFINFRDVQSSPQRCAQIVNATQLDADVASGLLPRFSFYIPNGTDNGHDTDVATADRWLQGRFGQLLDDPRFNQGTLLIVVFDEAAHGESIYCAFVGAGVRAGAADLTPANHYDLVRTIEQIFGTGTMERQDATAHVISGIWSR